MFRPTAFRQFAAFSLMLGFALSSPILFHQTSIASDNDEKTNIRVYKQSGPAVVSIRTGQAVGSGSILTSNGLVLTNAHVITSAQSRPVQVTLADGRKFTGKVVGVGNNNLDLALIQLQEASNLPVVKLAKSKVEVGQRAFAIGNPFGQFQGTFTTGIVSRVDTNLGLIQTDAAINPGNSGGPLLNSDGEQVGVNTAIYTRNEGNIGIGFAIATKQIQSFLTAYRQGEVGVVTKAQPRTVEIKARRLPLDGSVLTGRLGSDNPTLPFNVYIFQGVVGQQIKIRMISSENKPAITLISPNKLVLKGATNQNVVSIQSRLPATGRYTLFIHSGGKKGSGNYKIAAISE
jgi:S1-C subfamily serine protease